ncbi:unnamed protein product [Heterotrigona itama]|uniref:Uncharacterized protein n=1 Tax=Heterotrigona itama TaxID=395501 RepID=A0A6V7GT12_9HYME|nr:unnamed protein product [Heterotrigona itama]
MHVLQLMCSMRFSFSRQIKIFPQPLGLGPMWLNTFLLRMLLNTVVSFEPPRNKRDFSQCLRCQSYGHTKNYRNRIPIYVKCAGIHWSLNCPIVGEIADVKCYNFQGNHPKDSESDDEQNVENSATARDGTVWHQIKEEPAIGPPFLHTTSFREVSGPTAYVKRNIMSGKAKISIFGDNRLYCY